MRVVLGLGDNAGGGKRRGGRYTCLFVAVCHTQRRMG